MGRRSDTKCACYGLSLFLINAVAIAMVVIGALNTDQSVANLGGCKSQPFVPWFLIIGGSIIMCGCFVRELLKRTCECCNDCFDSEKCCRIGGKILKFSTTVLFDAFFMLISVAWLLLGTVRMVSMYNDLIGEDVSTKIQGIKGDTNKALDQVLDTVGLDMTNARNQANFDANVQVGDNNQLECTDLLYYFTFAVVIAGWIVAAISALYLLFGRILYNVVLCRPCKDPYRETAYDTRYA